jgi:CheY-like chemotaxis protein
VPRVLVVDDSATDRVLAGRLLQQQNEFEVSFANNGREALEAMRTAAPDAIVSDLQMPEMNGLELVSAVRRDYPAVPVVLMTAKGSEQIATEALRRGAASYVPKVSLGDHLRDTVRRIVGAARADRMHSRLMHSLDECDCRFVLRNDMELVEPLIAHLQELLRCLPLEDEGERLRVGQAVKHALLIAHYHGNLELPVDGELSDRDFYEEATVRRGQAPYTSRSLSISTHLSPEQAIFAIRHEGPGIPFDRVPADLPGAAVDYSWLSGFVLIPTVMDDVRYEDGGRGIALLKKATTEPELDLADE